MLDHAAARSLFAYTLAHMNMVHVDMVFGERPEPVTKLLRKQAAFLTGELQSRDNLQRFFEAFSEWRSQQQGDDSLGWRAADLSLSALYSSVESVFDNECDDTELLEGYAHEIQQELVTLQPDMTGLKDYFASILEEFQDQWATTEQLPVQRTFLTWVNELDVSLFGLSAD